MSNEEAIEGLRRHSQARAALTRRRIQAAIASLTKEHAPVNVNAVARRAGVTRKTIYRHTDLAARIASLREETPRTLRPVPERLANPTIIDALRHQLRQSERLHQIETTSLKAVIKQRENALAAAHGEIARLTASLSTHSPVMDQPQTE